MERENSTKDVVLMIISHGKKNDAKGAILMIVSYRKKIMLNMWSK